MPEHHDEFHTLTKPYGPCTPTCPHPDHQQTTTEKGTLTEAQRKAWPEAVARLREHYPVPESIEHWDVRYAEENRPGRGHFIDATLLDGEVFAQVLMDVYGYPNVSIATLDWLHADSNEECECEPCERERAEEVALRIRPDMPHTTATDDGATT